MYDDLKTKKTKPIPLRSYVLGVAVLWSLLIAISLMWNIKIEKTGTFDAARIEARTALEKDIIYRRWNAMHGGVYAPVTENTPSNPYLNIPERDIITSSGKKLTKINPAYMTRQVHEIALKKDGVKGHITSLNPIRPANAPDLWESQALKAFQSGVNEISSVEEMEGKRYMRLMRPLITEKGCLKCHAEQGYKQGDIRGGISVSVPMAPLMAIGRSRIITFYVAHGLLWLIGLAGIGFSARSLYQQMYKRMATEEELRESEKRYRSLVDLSPDIIYRLDEDGKIGFISPAVHQLGYDPEELVGRLFEEIVHPDDRGKGANGLFVERRVGQRAMNDEEIRILTKTGEVRDYAVTSKVVSLTARGVWDQLDDQINQPDKSFLYTQGVARDITERKKTEIALRESESKYRDIFKNVSDFLYFHDLEGYFIETNLAITKDTGYSEDDLAKMNIKDLVTEKYKYLFDDYLKEVMEKGESEGLMTIAAKDGSEHILEYRNSLVSDETGPIGIRGSARDITQHKMAEQAMTAAKEAAEAASRVKSEFLANMSHEIRTPLNAVLGFLELVLEDPSLPELQRKHLTTAQISANSLLGLINDILDVSKMESGKLRIEQRPFSLPRLMQKIHATMDIKAREKGLDLEIDIQPSLSESFVGDPLRLRQIIVNLVDNAVKFTKKGRVFMRVMPAEAENQLHFMIEDTGVGIPPDRLSQIFEPFTQADTSTTRRFGGTGLGTTIARELVELMGGRIWTESEEGNGSRFHFTINLTPTDQVPEEADLFVVTGKAVLPGFRHGFRILLVEDVEVNVDLAKIRLKQQGHEVMVAWNGREAVEVFQQGEIDVILMDVHMPEMDGLEATERIRALEAGTGGHVPIIAMTAGVMREETEKYLEVGMDAVVAKPIDFGKLFKTMESVVPEGVGEAVAEDAMDIRVPPGLELPPLDGVDIKKGLQTWQNPEAYAKALLGFSRDYGNADAELTRLIDADDIDKAYRIAHALKGVAGNLSVTKVADAAVNIDAALREKRMDDVKGQLPTLAAALNRAVDAIRQLEVVQDVEEMPKKEMDLAHLNELFLKMLAAFDQFSPYVIEPFLSELKEYLSQDQLNPIVNHMERFDFDGAKQETAKLAKMLKIYFEG